MFFSRAASFFDHFPARFQPRFSIAVPACLRRLFPTNASSSDSYETERARCEKCFWQGFRFLGGVWARRVCVFLLLLFFLSVVRSGYIRSNPTTPLFGLTRPAIFFFTLVFCSWWYELRTQQCLICGNRSLTITNYVLPESVRAFSFAPTI